MKQMLSTTPRIIMGPGSISDTGNEIKRLGIEKVLIVTGTSATAGRTKSLEASLRKADVKFAFFDGVEPEPRYETVADCVDMIAQERAQLIIGMGGGSPMDLCKVAAVMTTNPGPVMDYVGVDPIPTPGLPTLLVPTTAGTGSEVTPIAILSDEGEKLKKGIVSPYLYPSVAILDPELTIGLPPPVTAASGIDALIHAIEARTSINASGITDLYGDRAIRLIIDNLRDVYANGGDIQARSAMMEGALLAGMAFANAGVTAVHAFAFPIGAGFHIPHGIANALMFPHVIRFNMVGNLPIFASLAAPLGIPQEGLGDRQAVERVIATIDHLAEDIHIPRHLADFGVTEKDIPSLAHGVMKVTRLLANNRRPVSYEDAQMIYTAAL